MAPVTFGLVSLGCDKNRVDSEKLLYTLSAIPELQLTASEETAQIIIVNTCAFIQSATEESIDTILDMAQLKMQKLKLLIVTGCLAQRYYKDLVSQLPEVDFFIRLADYDSIPRIICDFLRLPPPPTAQKGRIVTTPMHYAYLKIAEGCDNCCTYCAIPSIRGKYRSEGIDALVTETQFLIDNYGIKELDLVAQDVTRYGIDLYNEYSLLKLLDRLSKLDVDWLRLNYCYPELVTPQLARYIADNEKLCKYLDIPLQHIDDKLLRLMNRRSTSTQIKENLLMLRETVPNISLRSTFIVGFPTETEQQFDTLLGFLNEYRLDNVGFFAYSKEEGTPAYKLSGQLTQKVKRQRVSQATALQTKIMLDKMSAVVGTTQKVLVDGIDYDAQCFYGHDTANAPSVDKRFMVKSKQPVQVGSFYSVSVKGTKKLDYIGEIINE